MYTEAVVRQNEGSGTVQSAADMEPRTPIFKAPPERPAEPTTPPAKTPAPSRRESQNCSSRAGTAVTGTSFTGTACGVDVDGWSSKGLLTAGERGG